MRQQNCVSPELAKFQLAPLLLFADNVRRSVACQEKGSVQPLLLAGGPCCQRRSWDRSHRASLPLHAAGHISLHPAGHPLLFVALMPGLGWQAEVWMHLQIFQGKFRCK